MNTAQASAWGQEGTTGNRQKLWRAEQKDGRNFDVKDKARWGDGPVFAAALLTVAKTWKQPQCPLTGMEKEDVVQRYNATVLSRTKNKIMPFAAT